MSTSDDVFGSGATAVRHLDAVFLWVGGIVTAAVAAFVTVASALVLRVMLHLQVLGGSTHDPMLDGSLGRYAAGAALVTLAATALLNVLLLSAVDPFRVFSWIAGASIVLALVAPFLDDQTIAMNVGTALVNLVVGATVLTLLESSSAASIRSYADR